MKKPTLWAGIAGALLIIFNVLGGAVFATHLTNIVRLNIAISVNILGAIAIGILLVCVYFNSRQKEEATGVQGALLPDSPEDKTVLSRRRNWILGVLFLFEISGSAPIWILNNYTAGLTVINMAVIFDVLVNIAIAYAVVGLLTGKKYGLSALFYASIVATLGWTISAIAMHQWFGAVISLVMGAYVVFAIKAPVNRKNFRIAHLVLLPLYIVLSFSLPTIDDRQIEQLGKKEALLEQQFTDINNGLTSDYAIFLNRQSPDGAEIPSVINGVETRKEKIDEIRQNIAEIQSAYNQKLPSIKQRESIERYAYLLRTLDIHVAQGDKVVEFMNYAKTVHYNALTEKQKEDLIAYKQAINDFSENFTQLQYEQDEAHLNY